MSKNAVVLDHLDLYMNLDAGLPPLVNTVGSHFQLADTQMRVFASSEAWAVIYEWIGYRPGSDEFVGDVYAYGSAFNGIRFLSDEYLGDTQDGGFLGGAGLIDMDSLSVNTHFKILGFRRTGYGHLTFPNDHAVVKTPSESVSFRIDGALMERHDVTFSRTAKGNMKLTPGQLIRYIVAASDHGLFRGVSELLTLINSAFPKISKKSVSDLKLLLQVRDWQHPDIAAGELPSSSPSFQILANMIASEDSSLWTAGIIGTPNTDWRLHYAPDE